MVKNFHIVLDEFDEQKVPNYGLFHLIVYTPTEEPYFLRGPAK